MSKSENICRGNVLNSMYTCDGGVCTSKESNLKWHYNH